MLTVTDSYVLSGDLRLHYRRAGEPGGRPLVLMHGLASNARIWDRVAPVLGRTYAVFAPDQRGHGLSDKPDDGYDFQTVSDDLAAFVEALGLERPVLVGHSWGANVVLHYSASRPAGRLAPSAAVLVDGGIAQISSLPGMTWEAAEEMMRPPQLAGLAREAFIERMAGYVRDPSFLTSEIVAIVMGNFEIMPDDTIRPRLTPERHMRIARALYDQPLAALYPRVRCPVLIAPASPPQPRSERDEQFLALKQQGADLAARLLPRSHTAWFDDTPHDIPLYRPEELSQAIESFLEFP